MPAITSGQGTKTPPVGRPSGWGWPLVTEAVPPDQELDPPLFDWLPCCCDEGCEAELPLRESLLLELPELDLELSELFDLELSPDPEPDLELSPPESDLLEFPLLLIDWATRTARRRAIMSPA
jgi:hypothetical protein